ncbi:MAG: 3D domain-containing protein, partial [Gaiellaceae bacterium]
ARRAATVSSLRREGAVTAQRLSALQARAQAAQRASAKLVAPETPATTSGGDAAGVEPAASAATTSSGDRTLVVDAVAYHLPGNTASGLPVGVGVIAVDPSVIPLGTRVFVPGYGAAVAADTGTAIKGNIIDLWMPSTARARAWGRRTVTITVYGS